jgi:hypothetical protein
MGNPNQSSMVLIRMISSSTSFLLDTNHRGATIPDYSYHFFHKYFRLSRCGKPNVPKGRVRYVLAIFDKDFSKKMKINGLNIVNRLIC